MKLLSPSLVLVGLLAVVGGLYLGFASVSVTRDSLICGRAFSSNSDGPRPDDSQAQDGIFYGTDNRQADCSAALSTRRVEALSTAIPGALLIVAGVVVWLRTRPATDR